MGHVCAAPPLHPRGSVCKDYSAFRTGNPTNISLFTLQTYRKGLKLTELISLRRPRFYGPTCNPQVKPPYLRLGWTVCIKCLLGYLIRAIV